MCHGVGDLEPQWAADPTRRNAQRWWDGVQWSDHVANGQYQSLDPLVRPRETRVKTVADVDPAQTATSNNKKIILHMVLGVATAGIWLLVLAVVALWRRGARGWSGALAAGLTLLIMAVAFSDGSTSTVDASANTTGATTRAAKQPLVATKPTAARATPKIANPKTTAKVTTKPTAAKTAAKTTAKVNTKPTVKKTAPKVTTKPKAKKTTPATIRGVHPGAYCSQHGALGMTSDGTLMRCRTTAADSRYRWRKA
jgi:hypothetical protein